MYNGKTNEGIIKTSKDTPPTFLHVYIITLELTIFTGINFE